MSDPLRLFLGLCGKCFCSPKYINSWPSSALSALLNSWTQMSHLCFISTSASRRLPTSALGNNCLAAAHPLTSWPGSCSTQTRALSAVNLFQSTGQLNQQKIPDMAIWFKCSQHCFCWILQGISIPPSKIKKGNFATGGADSARCAYRDLEKSHAPFLKAV